MNTSRLFSWFKELVSWLVEYKPILMGITVTIALILVCRLNGFTEASIRITGYLFQLIGMILAIQGLLLVRVHFGQPPFISLFRDWISRFPKWKKKITMTAGVGSYEVVGGKARAEIWAKDDPNLSTEERLEKVIHNLERIREEIGKHYFDIDDLNKNLERLRKESDNRDKEVEERLRNELKRLHTQDILTSLVGLFLLTVGITLSTLSSELFCFLNDA